MQITMGPQPNVSLCGLQIPVKLAEGSLTFVGQAQDHACSACDTKKHKVLLTHQALMTLQGAGGVLSYPAACMAAGICCTFCTACLRCCIYPREGLHHAHAGAGGRRDAQQPVRRGAPAASTQECTHSVPMQALAGGLVPSSLYGGEHLLRLLQRLPALLPTGGLAPAALASIEAGLAHFLKFLLRHQARWGRVCLSWVWRSGV